MPPSVALLGAMVVMVGVTATAVTAPFRVKSSNRAVPLPEAPLIVYTTVIVPVKPVMALETVVVPRVAPVDGIVPLPTEVPLIVIAQFCALVPDLTRQKLKDVTLN